MVDETVKEVKANTAVINGVVKELKGCTSKINKLEQHIKIGFYSRSMYPLYSGTVKGFM